MNSKHRNNKGTWFAGVTKCPADIENIKKNISEFYYYAYITHKPDNDDDRLHIHYVLCCNGSRSLGSVADTLDVDSQYLQICKQPRGANRYLIHLDNPEKEQYTIEDVTTNNKEMYLTYISDNNKVDCVDFMKDLRNLQQHKISTEDFVRKYSYHINKLPFYQRIKTMEVILKFGD